MSDPIHKPEPAEDAQQEAGNDAQPRPTGESAQDPSLETRLAEAQARIEQQHDAWLRALADADNARKRAAMDVAAAHKFAVEGFVQELLPVLDSLEAALAANGVDFETLRSGVELTLKQLCAAFEKSYVVVIAPVAGEKFDPNRHEAMAAVESDAEPNTVVALMQKGYSLNERVVRPALVTVAKPRPANDA
jgi:molecular chaperone GrpE